MAATDFKLTPALPRMLAVRPTSPGRCVAWITNSRMVCLPKVIESSRRGAPGQRCAREATGAADAGQKISVAQASSLVQGIALHKRGRLCYEMRLLDSPGVVEY